MSTEMMEYFMDMFHMVRWVVGEDKYVVKVHNDCNIQQVTENVVHESLKSCRGVGETKRHHIPLERTIAGMECSFPFITLCDADC